METVINFGSTFLTQLLNSWNMVISSFENLENKFQSDLNQQNSDLNQMFQTFILGIIK